MPALTYSRSVELHFTVHTSATDLLRTVGPALRARQVEANVILPHAEKLQLKERCGEPIAPGQFWISSWSGSSNSPFVLDFVLSCTEHHLGEYPIFLFSNHPSEYLTPAFLNARVLPFAAKLHQTVDPLRVFSIYGPLPLAKAMAKAWTRLTDMPIMSEPYYSASSSVCTAETFKHSPLASAYDPSLRLATMDDLQSVAALCHDFAADSPPFTLTPEQALSEAHEYISHGLVWVYEVRRSASSPPEIASIVAVTRSSDNVAAITKVFTNPLFRGNGCAMRLVARVVQHLLFEKRRPIVMLYVGHALAAARSVYSRVGFVGLDGSSRIPIEGVEDWLELGFTGARVGHW